MRSSVKWMAAGMAGWALTGCAINDIKDKVPDGPSVPAVVKVKATNKESGVTERVGMAAITPLSDLNVVQEEIPEALLRAAKGPYAVPDSLTCEPIQAEIDALDAALGADLDKPRTANSRSLLDRGTDMAENASVSAVRRTVEGLVPFRSWLRKLTGAEKHSQQMGSSIMSGGIRRAYLKGMRQGLGCPVPAPVVAATAPSSSVASSPEPSASTAPLPVAPAQPLLAPP